MMTVDEAVKEAVDALYWGPPASLGQRRKAIITLRQIRAIMADLGSMALGCQESTPEHYTCLDLCDPDPCPPCRLARLLERG